MTEEEMNEVYSVAKDVLVEIKELDDAIDSLEVSIGIKKNSARKFINVYVAMINGNCYKEEISVEETDYLLTQIFADNNKNEKGQALKALHEYIDYMQNRGKKMKDHTKIYDKYFEKL